jgi:hypothetical protein
MSFNNPTTNCDDVSYEIAVIFAFIREWISGMAVDGLAINILRLVRWIAHTRGIVSGRILLKDNEYM